MEGPQQIHHSFTGLSFIPEGTLKLVIEYIPECRDVLQLYAQLYQALPIQDFEALKNCGEDGMIRFRDMRFPIRVLEDVVPHFIFPINDTSVLIERLSHVIRLIPAFAGYDSSKEANIRNISQANFLRLFKEGIKNYSIPIGEYVVKIQDE